MNAESKTPRTVSKAVRRFRCVSMVNSLAKNWQKWANDHTHKQKTQPLGWQPGGSSEDYAKKPTPRETKIQPPKVPQIDPKSSNFNGDNVVSSKEQKEYQETKVSIRTVPVNKTVSTRQTAKSNEQKEYQETKVSIRTVPVNKTVSTRQTAKSNELVSLMSGRFNQPAPEEAPKPFLGDRSPTRRRLRLSKASELVQSWKMAEKEGQVLEPKCNLASDGGREKRKEGIEEESKDNDSMDDRGKRKKLVQKVQVRKMGELRKAWLRWADDHIQKQKLNPFSDDFDYDYAMSFRLKKGDQGYGQPKEGSKSAERGERAQRHIRREVDELCYIIRDLGIQGKDGMIQVTFGQLFDRYVTISDKVVGILMRARKHGLVDFPGEMLWQGRDDDVIITLMELQNPEY